MTLRLTSSCRFWSRVCMPNCCPVWMAEYICAILFSRMRLRIAGVPIMISCAATRPPPSLVLHSVWAMTARIDSEIIARIISFSAAGNTSTMRSMVFAAELVCSVPNTRCPVSAPVSASRIVSRSRISPTRITSGSSRSALREDPDVILVGEMRDLETIRLALTGAETGHLVFGTLHTSSAAKTIDRIIDVFPAAEKEMIRAMISESLRAVISQTLCKTKDGSGRVAAHEIMIGTPAIRNLIRENKIAQMYSAIQTGQTFGMQTLDQNLQDLVRRNVISAGEARGKAANKDNFPG